MVCILLCLLAYTDFRGVWIPRWSISDENEIFSHLDDRFNHIFLQVFANGEAYYPSDIAPKKKSSDRWLVNFLDEAHRRGIRVSAWINVFYSWGYAPPSRNTQHPITWQPNWYVQDKSGRSILDYSVDELKTMNIEGYYLSPSNNRVREYIVSVAEEIITKYDFDGLHLDYIRYPGRDFVNDAALRSKFVREYYIDPADFQAQSDMIQRYSAWGYDDLKKRWHDFIYSDLTQYIKQFRDALKCKRPELDFSVAVKPDYLSARDTYYQDWLTWLNTGYVDYVCLMLYTKNITKHLNKIQNAVNDPKRVMVGLGLYLLNAEQIETQVEQVDRYPYAGVVFFSYDQLKENPEYLRSLRNP
jgi:uncharacterized lipoprotein YddW (UPF0748 family)